MKHYNGFSHEVGAWLDEVATHEAAWIYTRWAALVGASIMTRRKVWLPFMNSKLYPNLYVLFVGAPASRKSTVIDHLIKMLREAGHDAFCPVDLTKASMLKELRTGEFRKQQVNASPNVSTMVDDLFESASDSFEESLWENEALNDIANDDEDLASPLTMVHHELQTLVPENAPAILSVVHDLWDCHDRIDMRGGSLFNVYVNMLCGVNTETLPVILDKKKLLAGLMSRLILVHGEKSGRKFSPFAAVNQLQSIEPMVDLYKDIGQMEGAMSISDEAVELFTKIDSTISRDKAAADARFNTYADRRVIHMSKMAMANALLRRSMTVEVEDIKYCHTLLCFTESHMQEALGDYGFSKEGQAYTAILNALDEAPQGLRQKTLLKKVSYYLTDPESLHSALDSLLQAGLIEVASSSQSGDMSTDAIYTKVKANLKKWTPHFGSTVFPETLPEWAMMLD